MGKKQKKASHGTPAIAVLEAAGCEFTVHEFPAGADHFGQHAAAALADLGVVAAQVFKTLVVDTTAGKGPKRQLAVCCVPVTGSLSLKKAAAALGVRAVTMADPAAAQRSSGYIPGGISPLGQKNQLPTVIDSSCNHFAQVFVSGGKRGLDVALAPADLVQLTAATVADVAA